MAKVIWADPAIQDLDAIADYVALDKPEAAHRLVRRVLAAVERLQRFPNIGSVPHELRGLPYRQLIVSPCRIFYRVEKEVVYIVHVLRGNNWFEGSYSLPNRANPNNQERRTQSNSKSSADRASPVCGLFPLA